jgi:hypothetical protein
MIDQRAHEFGLGRPVLDGLGEFVVHLLGEGKLETAKRADGEKGKHQAHKRIW